MECGLIAAGFAITAATCHLRMIGGRRKVANGNRPITPWGGYPNADRSALAPGRIAGWGLFQSHPLTGGFSFQLIFKITSTIELISLSRFEL